MICRISAIKYKKSYIFNFLQETNIINSVIHDEI